MSNPQIEIPFVWPDCRKLADCLGPEPEFASLIAKSHLVLGVIHGVTLASVVRLEEMLATNPTIGSNGNGQPGAASSETQIRLIVALYPTCPTRSKTLVNLLRLQEKHSSLEVRLVTCDLLSRPENALACYKNLGSLPTMLIGSSASMEDIRQETTHFTVAFIPDPILATEWTKWFDVRWLKAVRLTESRARIPHLVLPKGSPEAEQEWEAYERLFGDEKPDVEVSFSIDPSTGEVIANGTDGKPVATISTEQKLPKVSPIYRKLAQLLDMGHLVSVDKTTRLLPFEVSVKPKWFGLDTLKQIGSVKRQISYRISALTEDELKQLENRRKKTSELLDLFSFSLADSQRWMPSTAEDLFRQEIGRINTEAKGILSKLIAGDLDKFMAGRRKSVGADANRMYRDLFPDQNLSEEALNEIMAALKKRFEEAQQKSFLPQLSFNRVSLPQPQDTAWKSQLGSALHLLLSIIRYPRKASRNGIYFARGMTAKPPQILKAMNLLDDPFTTIFDQSAARDKAESELATVDAIGASDATAESKCEQLFDFLGHQLPNGTAVSSDRATGDEENAASPP